MPPCRCTSRGPTQCFFQSSKLNFRVFVGVELIGRSGVHAIQIVVAEGCPHAQLSIENNMVGVHLHGGALPCLLILHKLHCYSAVTQSKQPALAPAGRHRLPAWPEVGTHSARQLTQCGDGVCRRTHSADEAQWLPFQLDGATAHPPGHPAVEHMHGAKGGDMVASPGCIQQQQMALVAAWAAPSGGSFVLGFKHMGEGAQGDQHRLSAPTYDNRQGSMEGGGPPLSALSSPPCTLCSFAISSAIPRGVGIEVGGGLGEELAWACRSVGDGQAAGLSIWAEEAGQWGEPRVQRGGDGEQGGHMSEGDWKGEGSEDARRAQLLTQLLQGGGGSVEDYNGLLSHVGGVGA